jgi:2-methylcitrate dehydratase PrpD
MEGAAMTVLNRLASQIMARQPDDEALLLARHAFLDTAACVIAGETSEQVARLDASLQANGPADKALRDGIAAHALDFDDYEELGSTHPSAVIVPALLALASDKQYNIGQLLRAYVAGFEIILSVGSALGYGHYISGWHATSTTGRIGAAMAGAHLLGLDEAGTVTAVSLAMTQSAGLKAEFGSDAKALHAGVAARTAVEAALLAQAEFSAAPDVAEDFMRMYGVAASPGWIELFKAPLPTINAHPPYIKPSPTCGYTIRAIEAAEVLSHSVKGEDIAAITIRIPEPYYRVAGFDAPRNVHEARFSVVYCVAAGLVDGIVGVDSLKQAALQREDIRALMAVTNVDAYSLEAGLGDMSPDAPETVVVELKDGRTLSETMALARGGPGRLFTSGQVIAKFVACGGNEHAAKSFMAAGLDAGVQPFH